jgi:tetratricopeptide (TPR) repeat protein
MQNPVRALIPLVPVFLAILLGTGCSPAARKARLAKQADGAYAAQRYDEAEINYLNLLKLDPANAHAIGRLGLLYAEEGRVSRAIAFLLRGHDLAPDDLDLRIKLSQVYASTGNRALAREHAEFVLARRPQDPDAPLTLVLATAQPEEAADVRQKFERLPAMAAHGAPVLVARALLDLRERNAEEAEELVKQALAADPKFAPAYTTLGMLAAARNDRSAVRQAFQQAAELSPLRSIRRIQYARFLLGNNEAGAAKKLLTDLGQKAPDFIPTWTTLAEIALAERKYDEATGFTERALAHDPGNLEASLIRSRIDLARGNTDKGIAQLQRLTEGFPNLPNLHHELAQAYLAKGDTDKAMASLNTAVRLAPAYAEANVLLAGLEIRKGDPSTAIVRLRRLVQQRPDLPQARLYLADAYRRQGDPDNALVIYREMEAKQPDNPEIPLLRGLILLEQRHNTEARQALERAVELAPNSPTALEQLVNLDLIERKYDSARERVEALAARNPGLAGPRQLLLAKILLAKNDRPGAVAALQKAIQLAPDSPTAYFLLAGIYASENQEQKALDSLAEVIAKNPKDISALMLTAVMHDRQKNAAAARDAYEKLLAVNPRFSTALNNLAYLYAEQFGELDKAAALAQRARELQPQEPHYADTLGWIQFRKGQYPWALSLLQEAAPKLTAEPEVQYHLGMAYYMMGREAPARLALQEALKSGAGFAGADDARSALTILDLDPARLSAETKKTLEEAVARRQGDPVALVRLAAIYEREGDTARALNVLETALQRNGNNVNALIGLARLQAATQNFAKALESAKAARKLAPDDANVAHVLGRLAYQSGDYAWAASLLEEAARKNANDPELLFDLSLATYSVGRVADAESALRSALNPPGAGSLTLFAHASDARQLLDWIGLAANPAEAEKQSARIEQALKSDPTYVPALMASGAVSESKGNASNARQAYEKALAKYPNFTPAKLRLAILGAAQSEFDQKSYDWALQSRTAYPGSPEAAKALGILTYRKGDYARAVALLKESLTARSNDAELLCFLGLAQHRVKDAAAKQNLQRALELNLRPDLAALVRQTLAEMK